MIKKYSIILAVFLIISCKSKEEKMFFDFDTVEYYSLDKSKEKSMEENNSKSIDNGIFDKIFYDDYPEKVNDDVFYKTMNSGGFLKFELSKKDVEDLKTNIFSETIFFNLTQVQYACAPEYRDILVFKKGNKISGIAKICLSCQQFYIISSKNNIETENFGKNDEFQSLEKIFNLYKKE